MGRPHPHGPHSPHSPHSPYHPQSPHAVGETNPGSNAGSGGPNPETGNSAYSAPGHGEPDRQGPPDNQGDGSGDAKSGSG